MALRHLVCGLALALLSAIGCLLTEWSSWQPAHPLRLLAVPPSHTATRTMLPSSSASVSPVPSPSPSPSPSHSEGLVLVVAHSGENVSWIAACPFPVVLMTKGLPPGTPHNTPNTMRGFNAVSILQFILDEWDSLPEHTVFAHSHRSAWHINDMLKILYFLDPNSYGYAGLSSLYSTSLKAIDYALLSQWWHEESMADWISAPLPLKPEEIRHVCCAVFLVSRDRILAHPKEFYARLLNWLLTTPLEDHVAARILEWSWHVIFGEQWMAPPPDPSRLCPRAPRECQHQNWTAGAVYPPSGGGFNLKRRGGFIPIKHRGAVPPPWAHTGNKLRGAPLPPESGVSQDASPASAGHTQGSRVPSQVGVGVHRDALPAKAKLPAPSQVPTGTDMRGDAPPASATGSLSGRVPIRIGVGVRVNSFRAWRPNKTTART